jgi:hypothetical protein
MAQTTNIEKLTAAGVIPANYEHLSEAEKTAIEKLSHPEVEAIIGTKTKLGPDFFKKHAAHGMLY